MATAPSRLQAGYSTSRPKVDLVSLNDGFSLAGPAGRLRAHIPASLASDRHFIVFDACFRKDGIATTISLSGIAAIFLAIASNCSSS